MAIMKCNINYILNYKKYSCTSLVSCTSCIIGMSHSLWIKSKLKQVIFDKKMNLKITQYLKVLIIFKTALICYLKLDIICQVFLIKTWGLPILVLLIAYGTPFALSVFGWTVVYYIDKSIKKLLKTLSSSYHSFCNV